MSIATAIVANRGKHDLLRYAVGIAALTFLWAVIERLGYGIAARYTLLQVVAMRYGAQLLLLGLRALWRGPARLVATRHPGLQLARGFCMFVMPFSFIIGGAKGGTPGELWSAFWIAPIVIVLLARWWLNERFTRGTLIVLALGYVGALLVLHERPMLGVALFWPLVSALAFAVYMVLSRRLRDETLEASLFYTSAVAFACMLPLAVLYWVPIAPRDLPAIAGVGIVGLALLALLDLAVEQAPAVYFAPLLYAVVAWELLFAVTLSRETPQLLGVAGAAAVVVAVAVHWKLGRAPEKPA
jgi:S-adenosylmethionine uptake transporter